MLKELLVFPARNFFSVIPAMLVIGLAAGYFFDTSALKILILPVNFIMIYPSMIGFRLTELAHLSGKRILLTSLTINFLLLPAVAYFLGSVLLRSSPEMFAGLAIASLLPTSNMTVNYTMFSKGNVIAAIRLTVLSLVAGSLLAPWYLYLMVGKYVPVDIWMTFKTIAMIVFFPLVLGVMSFHSLMKRFTMDEFNAGIKPLLTGLSMWGVVFMIFISVSMQSKDIFNSHAIFFIALFAQFVFYGVNYALAILGSKVSRLSRADSFALLYSTVLRNLGISLGLATVTFGSQAALMVSLALLVQPLLVIWFMRLGAKGRFFRG